ncbi:MAG: hypothetical protein EBE86_034570 [Hormoscilla sp. GUM202]|nr:hypothetical protein [Hormoscilla sp. GUM202]
MAKNVVAAGGKHYPIDSGANIFKATAVGYGNCKRFGSMLVRSLFKLKSGYHLQKGCRLPT